MSAWETSTTVAWPQPVPPSATGSVPRWLSVLLVCMVACGTAYAFAAPRSGSFLTRDASLGTLLQDVDRGLVHTVYVQDNHIVWRPDGDWAWSAAEMRGFGLKGKPINGLAEVITEVTAVNSKADLTEHPPDYGVWWLLRGISILGAIGAFLLLVAGPQPRRATRWAWFWLSYLGRSSGLGVLAFLVLGPRRRRRRDAEQPAAEEERIDGWQGFAIAFVGSLVLAVTGALLQDYVVGDRTGSSSYTYDQTASPR